MLRWCAVAVCAAGCNAVFGLEPTTLAPSEGGVAGMDLDLDGIPDDEDRCLAAMFDMTFDWDQDGAANADDPCPLDDTAAVPDSDADGLPDTCDPFPSEIEDTLRCLMTFRNPDLNARLWRDRGPVMEWTSSSGMLQTLNPQGSGSIVATIDLETSPQPTFEIDIGLNSADPGHHGFQIWARAMDAPHRDDLGCDISGDDQIGRIAVVLGDDRDLGATTIVDKFPHTGVGVRMRMTFDTTPGASPNVRCSVIGYGIGQQTASATATLPAGRLGFATITIQANVTALAIYDRMNPAPL